MAQVEIVVAHHERTTLRVGDVFLEVDTDQTRTDLEVEAMALAPVPTPEILWRHPPVLALTVVPGVAPVRLGAPSTASPRPPCVVAPGVHPRRPPAGPRLRSVTWSRARSRC